MTKFAIIIIIVVILVSMVIYFLINKPKQQACPTCPEQQPCPTCPEQQPCPDCPTCPEQQPCPVCPTCPEQQPYPTCPVVINTPLESGSYYIQSKATDLFLNESGKLVQNKSDATQFTWNANTYVLTPNINGYELEALPTNAGVVLIYSGHSGTIFYLGTDVTGSKVSNASDIITQDIISGGKLTANLNPYTLQPMSAYARFVL